MNIGHSNYYILKIYLHEDIIDDKNIIFKYKTKISEIQSKFQIENGQTNELDAGFDLFVPCNYSINENSLSNKINHSISCSMTFDNKSTAYYLYPRSSMGSKTPLRLSNSVGIIDSGYRGHIIGLVDNVSNNVYEINKFDRLMQICGPNIMYPIYPIIVDNIYELGISLRGDNGFGSTGR